MTDIQPGAINDQIIENDGPLRSVYPAIVWIAMCAIYVVWAYRFNTISRTFPLMAGYLGLVLGVLDLISRLDGGLANIIRITMGAGFSNPEMTHYPSLREELTQVGWMTAFGISALFVGILPSVPAYVLLSMRINGRREWKQAIVTSLGVLFFVYLVFEVMLNFQLYRGVLFDARGFTRW